MLRRPAALPLALFCVVLAGCYEKKSENGGLVFTYELWVPLLVALGGLAAIPAGIALFLYKKRFWGVVLAILAGVVAPGMYLDRVSVNDEGFYSSHGFWWDRSVHQIRYDELKEIKVVVEESQSRRGKTYSYFFDCYFKSKKMERVPLGDVMKEALSEIVEQFRKHNVTVIVPPNLPE